MIDFLKNHLGDMAAIVGPFLVMLVTYLSQRLDSYLSVHIKESKTRDIMLKLDYLASSIVKDLMLSTVQIAKKDGNWNADTAQIVKKAAVQRLQNCLASQDFRGLVQMFGEEFIHTKIEAEVHDLKKEQT